MFLGQAKRKRKRIIRKRNLLYKDQGGCQLYSKTLLLVIGRKCSVKGEEFPEYQMLSLVPFMRRAHLLGMACCWYEDA